MQINYWPRNSSLRGIYIDINVFTGFFIAVLSLIVKIASNEISYQQWNGKQTKAHRVM